MHLLEAVAFQHVDHRLQVLDPGGRLALVAEPDRGAQFLRERVGDVARGDEGLAALVAFAIVHWSVDLGWDVFLSTTVHLSRRLWNNRVYVAVFALCGAVMVLFGLWFGAAAVVALLML